MKSEWMITFESAALLFAGLGLFFVGIRMLSEHLRQLVDRRLRSLLRQATRSDRSAAVLGLIGGAVTQSMNAVIFVLISLVRADALDVRRAQPVINFANLGTSLLVLIAALNLKLMVLILVGITGLLFYFERQGPGRVGHLIRTLLGIGLLFLGLLFIKDAAKPLAELSWVTGLMTLSAQSLLIAFLTGALLAVATQSASSVTIVTMALATSGVIDLDYALMVVYGAGIGTGLGTFVVAFDQKGLGRQLVLYQLTLKAMGLALLLPLFWVEFYGGIPLVAAGLSSLPVAISFQVAFSYILYQLASDGVMHVFHHRVQHMLEHRVPPTVAETLGHPHFIYAGAQKDAASALVLAEREQLRLLELLPEYLDSIREEVVIIEHDRMSLHEAGVQVAEACERFLEEVLSGSLSESTLDHAIILKNRNQLLMALQETLNDLVTDASRALDGDSEDARALVQNLLETLHMLLLTLTDAAGSGDPEDVRMLQALTVDRSELMHAIRRRLLASGAMEGGMREATFAATSLFERAVWLMRRYTILLNREESVDGTADV